MNSRKISGRLATRVVGALQLVISLILFALWIYVIVTNTKIRQEVVFFVVIVSFGIYFMVGAVGNFILVYATFSHADLKYRKFISVAWCFYYIASFLGSIILMSVTKWFEHLEWVLLMFTLMFKWSVCICVVFTYVWGLSKAIQESRRTILGTYSKSKKSMNKAGVSKEQQQWRQVQSTHIYGAFATKKQFC